MAKVYFRKDTGTWYVQHKRQKIRVGKSERAAKHLADKIKLEQAEGKACWGFNLLYVMTYRLDRFNRSRSIRLQTYSNLELSKMRTKELTGKPFFG